MDRKRLSEITTQWSVVEELSVEGPEALMCYLIERYFHALDDEIRARYHSNLGTFDLDDLVSEVILELIKNKYQSLKRLDRERGKLRGLLYRILKRKNFQFHCENEKLELKKKFLFMDKEREILSLQKDPQFHIYLDLKNALDGIKGESPKIYDCLTSHYFEGKLISEIASERNLTEGTIKTQLFRGRQQLEKLLDAYKL